jgi:RimJ/RimL family protein N-acetyltransferase
MQAEIELAACCARSATTTSLVFGAMNADPQVMRYSRRRRAPSDALVCGFEMTWRSGLRDGRWRSCKRAAHRSGAAIPRFEAPFTPCVEVGWRKYGEHWGKRLRDGGACIAELRLEELGLDEIPAWTTPGNVFSWRVMEKLGRARSGGGSIVRACRKGTACASVLYRISRERFQRAVGSEPP